MGITLQSAVGYVGAERLLDILDGAGRGRVSDRQGKTLVGQQALAWKMNGYRCARAGGLDDLYSVLCREGAALVRAECWAQLRADGKVAA